MEQQPKILFQKMKYALLMRPVFNTEALFSDETENFVSPMEPAAGDKVKIRIRTQKDNADSVYFISGAVKKEMVFIIAWVFREICSRAGRFVSRRDFPPRTGQRAL